MDSASLTTAPRVQGLEIEMARFTIKTRTNGDLDFFCPDGGGYVRLERGAQHGTLGRQIGAGGGFSGNMLTATPESLEAVARRWYRAFRADQRQYGYEL
jgi:hypothetical protein